jgi:hypothetical protein
MAVTSGLPQHRGKQLRAVESGRRRGVSGEEVRGEARVLASHAKASHRPLRAYDPPYIELGRGNLSNLSRAKIEIW